MIPNPVFFLFPSLLYYVLLGPLMCLEATVNCLGDSPWSIACCVASFPDDNCPGKAKVICVSINA